MRKFNDSTIHDMLKNLCSDDLDVSCELQSGNHNNSIIYAKSGTGYTGAGMSVARVARKIGFASVSFPPRRQNWPLAMQERRSIQILVLTFA